MSQKPIISRAEALQILRNELRKAAVEKHASELRAASLAQRAKLLHDLDQQIEKDIKRRAFEGDPDNLLERPFWNWFKDLKGGRKQKSNG
jgi:hypothetical protein